MKKEEDKANGWGHVPILKEVSNDLYSAEINKRSRAHYSLGSSMRQFMFQNK